MPLAESMISTLKSNKRIMLDKSRHFRKTLGGYDKKRSKLNDYPKATEAQLSEIRERMKRDNRILWIKVISIALVVSTILVWMLFAS